MDCNLGSEIGQKMRSAVKAKLLELGTGGSAGFIDDELPDYVMVMVANKRTKQQMNAELNLFLGDQTDLFVTWLHEVLQKLQEVTLPASGAGSKKRKSRQGEAPKAKDKDKDKKGRDKKDKRTHRKSGDSEQFNSSADQTMPTINSITDVFAEELLEKAKKTLDVDDEMLIKKKKRKATEENEQQHPATQEAGTKELDVPNMSEISSTTMTSGNREKDIAELAEIQRKIYAAKQHLRQIGELEDESDVEEQDQQLADDVLNVTDPDEPLVKDSTSVSAAAPAEAAAETNSSSTTRRAKSPIVFNRSSEPAAAKDKPKLHTEPAVQLLKTSDERSERRPVHERLGSKPIQPAPASAQQQQQPATPVERSQRSQKEMELYVPAHRRRNDQQQQQQEESKKVERGRERGQRNDSQTSRRRERESLRGRHSQTRSRSPDASYKHRIGSRVIVAINKPPEPSDDEDIIEKPVNSVIKIKPRPTVSPRRQACKNLLLRAVADAQRSTILAKPTASAANAVTSKSRGNGDEPELISSTVGKRRVNNSLGIGAGKELFRRSRRELVVNVLHRESKRMRHSIEPQTELKLVHKELEDEVDEELEEDEEEYVPSLSVGEYEEYVPQIVQSLDMGMDIDMHVEKNNSNSGASSSGLSKTQFVVTLNGDHSLSKAAVAAAAAAASYRKHSRKRTPSPQVSSTSSTNVQLLNAEPTSTTCASSSTNSNSRDSRDRRSNNKSKRARSSSRSSPSTSCNTPPQKPSRSLHRSDVLRQTQEIKKIIIKNDADNDDDEEEEQQHQQLHTLSRKRSQKKRLSSSCNINAAAAATASSTSDELKAGSKTQLEESNRSTTPPLPPKRSEKHDISNDKSTSISTVAVTTAAANTVAPAKVKHTPIRFKLKPEDDQAQKSRRSSSKDRDSSMERRRISIRNAEDRKYDNLPALSAVSVDSTVLKVTKPKERCKYHPNCSKQFCEYYHPTAPCKSFPNCKFADKCMYSHPKCKFDLACMSIDCNFAHSGSRDLSHVQLAAPPLSSHVIPVQNYKSISAPATATTGTTMCKYYPNCTKVGCTFYHPKPCRYGKNCINKLECIFYHPEMQSKFKWVASLG